ncbi:DUF6164 family protein [Allohahella sp. A8]|uniref:DUF6164 family protein n=1 Tax=Allohahella sp. A8 TaxID=3141461 RepID=UPI000C0A572C|nr:hypothetical protein [Hahellaceae bacterium]|tara:strand:+ start:188858 stop:189202 length:345 start_codon:yes stop_codon:yes gene_type:complete
MRELLFHLRGVPDDEADDVRELLKEAGIEFYETEAGRWNLSVPALWLPDGSQLAEARALIDAYQHERYERAQADPPPRSWWANLLESPVRVIVYLGVIGGVLYLSTMPFMGIGE